MIRTLAVVVFAGVLATTAFAQAKPKVETVSPTPTSPADGKAMFKQYCAVCHGMDGKGAGPASGALKAAPSDLTALSARNGGKFPDVKVFGAIKGEVGLAAHGSKEMPIWGDVFRSMGRSEAEAQLRITNITNYVKSIQK